MKPGELRPAVNVDDELERDRLVRRKKRATEAIQNVLNTTAYYNRLHPEHSPIPYDDAAGSLERSCVSLGLDFAAMVAKAEGRVQSCAICEQPIRTGLPVSVTGPVVCASCMNR